MALLRIVNVEVGDLTVELTTSSPHPLSWLVD